MEIFMEHIIVRNFIEEDAKDLKDIYFRIRKEEFAWSDKKDTHLDDFDSSTEGELILVATVNENIVGYASIWEADSFIHHLFIKKEFRKLGVGKALLDRSKKAMEKSLTLKCVKENKNAVEFYIANGWNILREEMGPEGLYYLMEYEI